MISRPRMGLAFILADARNPPATASHGATDLAPPGEMAPHCEVHKTEPSALVRREAASALPALTLTRQDGSTYPLAALTEAALVAMRDISLTIRTTLCPVMTTTFVQARAALGADAARIQRVGPTGLAWSARAAAQRANRTSPCLNREGAPRRSLDFYPLRFSDGLQAEARMRAAGPLARGPRPSSGPGSAPSPRGPGWCPRTASPHPGGSSRSNMALRRCYLLFAQPRATASTSPRITGASSKRSARPGLPAVSRLRRASETK